MLFNSIDFALFLPVVFLLYWFVFNYSVKVQNLFLLVASYFFYSWWDWRFLSLILISTFSDFILGRLIANTSQKAHKTIFLATSVIINIGILGFFKYYNFFIENFISTFSVLGFDFQISSLKIILPVGISFYTFQTLSYTIDIYRSKIKPSTNFIEFAAFVTFFPQLVAGPIERASNLIPQFAKARTFNEKNAIDGLRQILWGLFKKVVVADSCAEYVDWSFSNIGTHSGSELLIGAFFFLFQLYGDFSGYSDIAIGTARLFGFNLKKNFDYPFFSRDVSEFWRRWHISLTTWFRDYLYIPLGGSRVNTFKKVRNVFAIFIVSGFWHGAEWTYIFWGFLSALFFLPLILVNQNRKYINIVAEGKIIPTATELFNMIKTLIIMTFVFIVFRSNTIQDAVLIYAKIFSTSVFTNPVIFPKIPVIIILAMLFVEWFGRTEEHALAYMENKWSKPLRWGIYYLIIFLVFVCSGKGHHFIYFQF